MSCAWSSRCATRPDQLAAAAWTAGVYLEMAFDTIAGHTLPMVVAEVRGEPWLVYPSVGSIPCWIAAKAMRVYGEWAGICGTDGILGPADATAERLIATLLSGMELAADPNRTPQAILPLWMPDPSHGADPLGPLVGPPAQHGRVRLVTPVSSRLGGTRIAGARRCLQRIEHTCETCKLMMRKVDLGSGCPSCDELLLLQELVRSIGARLNQPLLHRQRMHNSS